MAYAANGPKREFGIRLALGAVGATRFLRAAIRGETNSVAEFGLATALLAVVTLIATLLPARRAAQTHPAVVLLGE